MELSLLLATYNNAKVLRGLLESLILCERPENWEMIIVDNGSPDNTAELVRAYVDRLPVIYVYEGARGKSRALNTGMKHARGDIILYTDDDIVPDKHWLVNHVRVMRAHPQLNVVCGKIIVDKAPLPSWLVNSYNLMGMLVSEHDMGDQQVIYDSNKFPYGPNMAVRKSAIVNLDKPWPENLGPGTGLPVGDEIVFIQNMGVAGNKRLYTPDCVVEHKPVIGSNFFMKSIRRCFLGGYSSGRYIKYQANRAEAESLLNRSISRISSCKSVQEFGCILSRAAGVMSGRMCRHFLLGFYTIYIRHVRR